MVELVYTADLKSAGEILEGSSPSVGIMKNHLIWSCMHPETTEPDENGDVICLKCGAVYQKYFNLKRFRAAIKKFYDK